MLLLATGVLFAGLSLLVVDLVAGFFVTAGGPSLLRGDTVSTALAYMAVNQAPMVPDDELLWRSEPYARKVRDVNPRPFGTEQKWSIAINSEGFRGPERHPEPDRSKVYRILAVGDSITYGFDVDQADSYPAQLLALLSKRYPDRNFEIINAGVPGWTWLQGLQFLKGSGMQLEPDLVVIGHGTNDQFFLAKITDKERFRVINNPIKRALHFVTQFWFRSNLYLALGPPSAELVADLSPECRMQIQSTGSCHRVSIDEIAAAIHAISELVTANGADLLLINTDFAGTPANQGIKLARESEKLRYLDLIAELDRRRVADEDALAERLGLAKASAGRVRAREAKQMTLRALVPDASHHYRVEVKRYFGFGEAQTVDAFDDGTHGDEKAGDLVYSNTVTIKPMDVIIEYKFFQDQVPEFIPLPPIASGLNGRPLDVRNGGVGPVVEFGNSLLMAERAHPNRNGHEVVSSAIADRLTTIPSFERKVLDPAQ